MYWPAPAVGSLPHPQHPQGPLALLAALLGAHCLLTEQYWGEHEHSASLSPTLCQLGPSGLAPTSPGTRVPGPAGTHPGGHAHSRIPPAPASDSLILVHSPAHSNAVYLWLWFGFPKPVTSDKRDACKNKHCQGGEWGV